MINRPYRTGNFYNQIKDRLLVGVDSARINALVKRFSQFRARIANKVIFHFPQSSVIREIVALQTWGGDKTIRFEISNDAKNVLSRFRAEFSKEECEIQNHEPYSVSVKLKTTGDLDKIKMIFTDCAPEFTKDLETELQQILKYIPEVPTTFSRHVIPDFIQAEPHVNPDREHSKELVKMLWMDANLDNCTKLLANGANPNETLDGVSPLLATLNNPDIRYTDLLLAFGADPTKRGYQQGLGSVYQSPLEIIQQRNDIKRWNLIASKILPERPLASSERPKLRVVKNKLVADKKQQITTTFNFSDDKTLTTVLKKNIALTEKDKENLFNLFCQFFEVTPEAKDEINMRKIFENDFLDKEKFSEFIFDNNKLIGFNLFELIKLKKHLNHFVVHLACSGIDPQYSGYGIASLLAFRFAFGILLSSSKFIVGVYFSALHYNSYRAIKDLLHFPKYQSDHIHPLIDELLKALPCYGESVEDMLRQKKCFIDNLTFYFKEQFKVKGGVKLSGDPNQLFFYRNLQGFENGIPTSARSTPVFLYAGDELFLQLRQQAGILGIDFGEHITNFARLLNVFDFNFLEEINFKRLLRSNMIFWKLKEESANDVGIEPSLRSMV